MELRTLQADRRSTNHPVSPRAQVSLVQLSLDFSYWTDDDILLLMDGVMTYSLNQLNDSRSSEEGYQEALEWIMSDELHPFSFLVCAHALGYDPFGLRDATLAIVKQASH